MTISTWHRTLYIMWLLCTAAVLTQCVCYLTPPAYLWPCQYILVLSTLYSSVSLWAERQACVCTEEALDKAMHADTSHNMDVVEEKLNLLYDIIRVQNRRMKVLSEKAHPKRLRASSSEPVMSKDT